MSNILIVSTSLRAGSNSDALAASFARGAAEAGHNVTTITLRGKRIAYCRGCFACATPAADGTRRCVIADDAIQITQAMHDADTIVFATPVYYYGMCGQMKTLLDRSNSLYDSDYRFRDIYLLTAATENETDTPARTIEGLKGWIVCFDRARLAATAFAGGVTDCGDIKDHPALEQAYQLGRQAK